MFLEFFKLSKQRLRRAETFQFTITTVRSEPTWSSPIVLVISPLDQVRS